MMGFARRFVRDDDGATAIEYALIAGGVFLAIVSGATGVGEQLNATFTAVNSGFTVH
jgi:pilus assembly protein Flp/PilA